MRVNRVSTVLLLLFRDSATVLYLLYVDTTLLTQCVNQLYVEYCYYSMWRLYILYFTYSM